MSCHITPRQADLAAHVGIATQTAEVIRAVNDN
jgi:hypothetical protein